MTNEGLKPIARRLILLNGPPAVGKTTLARRYAAEHPGTLCLDIDEVRALLPDWRADPHSAGLLARGIALHAARRHLAATGTVIVPQFLARPEFINQLAGLAENCHAEFHELVLLGERASALRRFAQRGTFTADEATLVEMHDRLLALLPSRPKAVVVRSIDGEVDQTYQAVLRALFWTRGR